MSIESRHLHPSTPEECNVYRINQFNEPMDQHSPGSAICVSHNEPDEVFIHHVSRITFYAKCIKDLHEVQANS